MIIPEPAEVEPEKPEKPEKPGKKKKKDVLIRQGIPFCPVFLISYIALIYLLIIMKFSLFYSFM